MKKKKKRRRKSNHSIVQYSHQREVRTRPMTYCTYTIFLWAVRVDRSWEVENSGSEVAGVKEAERVGQRQRGNSIERKHQRYLTVKNGSVLVHTETRRPVTGYRRFLAGGESCLLLPPISNLPENNRHHYFKE